MSEVQRALARARSAWEKTNQQQQIFETNERGESVAGMDNISTSQHAELQLWEGQTGEWYVPHGCDQFKNIDEANEYRVVNVPPTERYRIVLTIERW